MVGHRQRQWPEYCGGCARLRRSARRHDPTHCQCFKSGLSMDSKLGFRGLQPQRMDQRRKRSRLLPSARVVEKESGEGLAPVFQHADERPALEMLINLIL